MSKWAPNGGGGPLSRILPRWVGLRPGEGLTVLFLGLDFFFVLLAYYLLKTVREVLILGTAHGSAELKIYSNAAQAVALVGVSFGFGLIATRENRLRLIAITTVFFVAMLTVFYLLFLSLPSHRLALGVAFYIWLGCFNTTSIAALWGFATDLYPKERGERLFPLVAGGAALGALAGAALAAPLYRWFGPFPILLVAAALLLGTLAFTVLAHRREAAYGAGGLAVSREEIIGPDSALTLIRRDPYLKLIALLSLIKNWVNSGGEYILDRQLVYSAHNSAFNHHSGQAGVQASIAIFKSHYLTYTSLLVVLLQFFVVGRVLMHAGVARALFVLPIVTFAGYGWAASQLTLGVLLTIKVGENGLDYSLQKTTEQALYLITTREAKYKVKMLVDTFIVRAGDVLSAACVFVGTRLAFRTVHFVLVNMVMAVAWLVIVMGLAERYRGSGPSRGNAAARRL